MGACHTSSHLIVDIVSSCYRQSIFYQLGAYKNVIHTTPVSPFFFELRNSSFPLHINRKMHPRIVRFSIHVHLKPGNTNKLIICVFKTLLGSNSKVQNLHAYLECKYVYMCTVHAYLETICIPMTSQHTSIQDVEGAFGV